MGAALGIFISFAVSMIGLLASKKAQDRQNDYNKELVDQQNMYNKEAIQLQHELNRSAWSEQNEYDLPVNQMQRLADAGINKNLAASYIQGGSTPLNPATVTPNIAAGKNAFNPSDILGNLANMFSGAGTKIEQSVNVKVNTENAKIQQEILDLNKRVIQGKASSIEYELEMKRLADNFLVQDKDGNYLPAWMLKVQGESARANMQTQMAQFLPLDTAARLQKYADEHNISELNARNIAAIIKERGEKHRYELKKMGIDIDYLVAKLQSQEFQNQLDSLMTPKMMQEYVRGLVDQQKAHTYNISADQLIEDMTGDTESSGTARIFGQTIKVLKSIFGK